MASALGSAMPLHTSAAARLASVLPVLRGLGVTARDTHLRMLRETLDTHTHYFGVWSVWEPDALDGNDRAFRNGASHDATGRFKPWWHRHFGEPRFEVSQDCDDPVLGSYYQQPTSKRSIVVIAPYRYPVGNDSVLLATVAAPILAGERCLGAAGVDFSLDALAERVASGCDKDTLAQVDLIAEELELGFVFVDRKHRVLACSTSVADLLQGVFTRPLEHGCLLPGELRPVATEVNRLSDEATVRQHAITIRAAGIRPVGDEPMVLVLTRSVAEVEVPPLSAREDEVMRWLSEGKSNEEIGIILSISPHTVKNHLDRIYRKIGVDNRHAATLTWARSKALTGVLPASL